MIQCLLIKNKCIYFKYTQGDSFKNRNAWLGYSYPQPDGQIEKHYDPELQAADDHAVKATDPILAAQRIFNGITNYIFDQMERDGLLLDEGITQTWPKKIILPQRCWKKEIRSTVD